MSKKSFMPRTDLEKQQWLQNFTGKLASYAAKYNISPAELADMDAGSTSFTYWLNYRKQYEEYFRKLTQYKNELRDGIPAGATPSTVPVPPVAVAPPPAVGPGIFTRASSLGVVIKNKSAYTISDGADLGIEGADHTMDPQQMKPLITVRLIAGGHPEIVWKKNGMDGIEIYADHGTGNFAFTAVDTFPNYADTAPLPAIGISQLWKYKAIYRFEDAQAGLWSDIISITVTGV